MFIVDSVPFFFQTILVCQSTAVVFWVTLHLQTELGYTTLFPSVPARDVRCIEYIVHGSKNGLLYYNLIDFGALLSKMSTTFRSVSYGPCSRTGVTCVASDFGGII